MRLHDLLRRRQRASEPVEPELERLFLRSSRVPLAGVAELARGRARVAAALAHSEAPAVAAPTGGLRRRLALGTAGSAGLWATVVGTAAAHKAVAAAAGLVLVGGAMAAEGSGLGPAVREAAFEAVGIERSGESGSGARSDVDVGASASVTGDSALASLDAPPARPALDAPAVGPAEGSNGSLDVEPAVDAPGNLLFNAHGAGETRDFTARALLGWDTGEPFLAAAGGVRIAVTDETELRAPGRDELALADLEALAGRLVSARGWCEYAADGLVGCTADRLQLLGGAPAELGVGSSSGEATGGPPAVPPGRSGRTPMELGDGMPPTDASAEASSGAPAPGRPVEKGPPPGHYPSYQGAQQYLAADDVNGLSSLYPFSSGDSGDGGGSVPGYCKKHPERAGCP